MLQNSYDILLGRQVPQPCSMPQDPIDPKAATSPMAACSPLLDLRSRGSTSIR